MKNEIHLDEKSQGLRQYCAVGSHELMLVWLLRAGEMTLESESSFDPGANLYYGGVAINDPEKSSILRVRIKASKDGPIP